jgi:hypothetical protein
MKTDRSPIVPLVVATAILLGMATIYVGSYFALLQVEPNAYSFGRKYANYRFGGRISAIVFFPLESIDRAVRPSLWREDDWEFELE